VTINEVRRSKGLSPLADGDLTLPAYRAKHASTYAQNTTVQAAGQAAAMLNEDSR